MMPDKFLCLCVKPVFKFLYGLQDGHDFFTSFLSRAVKIHRRKLKREKRIKACVKKALKSEQIPIIAEDIGGDKGRTMILEASTGKVILKMVGQGTYKLQKLKDRLLQLKSIWEKKYLMLYIWE